MTTTTNAKNLRYYKGKLFLIVEKKLVLDASTNLVRKVINLSPNKLHNNVLL